VQACKNASHLSTSTDAAEHRTELDAAMENLSRANTILLATAHRFEELFQGIPVACFTYDAQGLIREWNRAAEYLFGLRASDVFEKTIWDTLCFEEDAGNARDVVGRVFSGESLEGLNWKYRRADGSVCRVLCNNFPLRHLDGTIIGGISASVDITQRIQAEAARLAEQQRKVAIADAVGDIAHDLKNMMSPVEGWADTLQCLLPDGHAALERLSRGLRKEQAEDLAALQDLLSLLPDALEGIRSGAEDAKDRGAEIADALKGNLRAPQFVVRQIANTASRVLKTLKNKAEAAGIRLSLEGTCRPFAYDQAHLFNAIYNLVYNAIQYTPNGRITIRLSEQEGSVVIEVMDTGKGIPENVLQSLFSDRTLSTTPGGTGLGTRIAAGVAAIHGGTVTATSKPGKGTCMRLALPLNRG
jgi:PAS domain S-box-containing protein